MNADNLQQYVYEIVARYLKGAGIVASPAPADFRFSYDVCKGVLPTDLSEPDLTDYVSINHSVRLAAHLLQKAVGLWENGHPPLLISLDHPLTRALAILAEADILTAAPAARKHDPTLFTPNAPKLRGDCYCGSRCRSPASKPGVSP